MNIWEIKINETVILYCALVVLFLWIWSTEADGNKCHDVRRRECGSDKYRIDPEPGDTEADLLQRLEGHARLNEEKVIWRRSILYAIVITLAIHLILFQRLPDAWEFIVSVAILYILIYIMNQYYMMHFDYRTNNKAIRTINELRSKLGLRTRTEAHDLNGL